MAVSKDYLEDIAEGVKKQLPEGHAVVLLVCEIDETRSDNIKHFQAASNLFNRKDFVNLLNLYIEKLETDVDNKKNNRWFL